MSYYDTCCSVYQLLYTQWVISSELVLPCNSQKILWKWICRLHIWMHAHCVKSDLDLLTNFYVDLGKTSHKKQSLLIYLFCKSKKQSNFPPREINQLAFCGRAIYIGQDLTKDKQNCVNLWLDLYSMHTIFYNNYTYLEKQILLLILYCDWKGPAVPIKS